MNRPDLAWYSAQVLLTGFLTIGILSFSTNGFTTYTYESARRAGVAKTPVSLSNWQLQDTNGNYVDLHEFGDTVLFVDFIYTRCPTICRALGSRYGQLQNSIDNETQETATLLSVSIEPTFDTPDRLQQYGQRYGGQFETWRITRPLDTAMLQHIVDDTGIKVIPDGWGGYAHSDSVHVIKAGKLIQILDWHSDELPRLIASSSN